MSLKLRDLQSTRFCCMVSILFAALNCNLSAQRVSYPGNVAFNNGVLSQDAISEAVNQGKAERIATSSVDEIAVRHIRIEYFENSSVSTRNRQAFFIVCESLWHDDVAGTWFLKSVKCSYVTLNYEGQATGPDSWDMGLTEGIDAEGKFFWKKTFARGKNTQRFHDLMPEWIKEKLWLVSGFLSLNPGGEIVKFEPTADEAAAGFLGKLIDFAPTSGLIKGAIGSTVETALKNLTKEKLKSAAANKEIKWGAANDITNAQAIAKRDDYIKEGKKMWTGS